MSRLDDVGFWKSLLQKILKIIFKSQAGTPSHHQHVVPHKEGWAVKGEGNNRYTSIHRTQAAAIRRAKEIAQNYRADVVVHREDGTIRDRIHLD